MSSARSTQEEAETRTLVRVRVRPRSAKEQQRSSNLKCLEGGRALALTMDGRTADFEFDQVYGACGCRGSSSLCLCQNGLETRVSNTVHS